MIRVSETTHANRFCRWTLLRVTAALSAPSCTEASATNALKALRASACACPGTLAKNKRERADRVAFSPQDPAYGGVKERAPKTPPQESLRESGVARRRAGGRRPRRAVVPRVARRATVEHLAPNVTVSICLFRHTTRNCGYVSSPIRTMESVLESH